MRRKDWLPWGPVLKKTVNSKFAKKKKKKEKKKEMHKPIYTSVKTVIDHVRFVNIQMRFVVVV